MNSQHRTPAPNGGFLFAMFKVEATPMSEQIYFALSPDGRHWKALGDEPVLISTLGERGVRDPFLLRSDDGNRFYLLATGLRDELRIALTHESNFATTPRASLRPRQPFRFPLMPRGPKRLVPICSAFFSRI